MAQTKRSLSGIRVTGRFHLGNYLGAGINYVRLQDEYESYIFVADYHTLTTKPNAREFSNDLYEMVMDLIAIGVDPERTVIYRQSAIPKVAELTLLLAMVTPLSWVQRVPTFKGTDGKATMSKSLNNIIGVTDPPEVITKQVMSMVTDTKRVYKTQPGHPRTCNVCGMYKLFFDDWEHYWELCRKAQIGCQEKKKLLAERLIELFRPFREVRAELSPGQVSAILDEGSEKAREVASRTMVEVRQAVGLPSYLNAPGR